METYRINLLFYVSINNTIHSSFSHLQEKMEWSMRTKCKDMMHLEVLMGRAPLFKFRLDLRKILMSATNSNLDAVEIIVEDYFDAFKSISLKLSFTRMDQTLVGYLPFYLAKVSFDAGKHFGTQIHEIMKAVRELNRASNELTAAEVAVYNFVKESLKGTFKI